MVGEILFFGLLAFVAILLINIAGKIISTLIDCNSRNNLFSFFLDCLTGIVLMISIYAIISTKGKTINWGFILLFLAYYYSSFFEKLNHGKFTKEGIKSRFLLFIQTLSDKKYIIHLSYAFIASFLTAFSSILFNHNISIDNDIIFYTKIAENLNKTGLENTFHYYNDNNFNGTNPYHYFELWLGSLFFPLLEEMFPNIIIFKYLIYSILKTVLILGLLSIIETIKKVTYIDVLFAVFLTFVSFIFLTEIGSNSWVLYGHFWLRPNLIMYFLFLIPALIYFKSKNYRNAFFFLMCLPVVSIVTAPATIAGIVSILLSLAFFNGNNRKPYYKMLLLTLFLMVYLFLFYHLTGVKAEVLKTDDKNLWELILHNLNIWKAIVGTTFSLGLRVIILLALPLLLIFLLLKNGRSILQDNFRLITIAIAITFSGIIVFQLTTSIDNTYQFPYIGYALCYLINFYMICILVYSFNKTYKKALFLTFLIPLASFTFIDHLNFNFKFDSLKKYNLNRHEVSDSFSGTIETYLFENPSAKGGFILSKNDIAKMTVGQRHSLSYLPGNYISYLSSNTHLTSLTDPDILYLNIDESMRHFTKVKSFNEQLEFYRRFHSSNLPYPEFLQQYLKSHHYNFIIAGDDIDLSFLSIDKSIKDTVKEHQFIILQ